MPDAPRPVAHRCLRTRLTRRDFERHGYTPHCAGCRHIASGAQGSVNHGERCRARLEAILAGTTEGKERLERAAERFTRYAAEIIEEQDQAAPAEVPRQDEPPADRAKRRRPDHQPMPLAIQHAPPIIQVPVMGTSGGPASSSGLNGQPSAVPIPACLRTQAAKRSLEIDVDHDPNSDIVEPERDKRFRMFSGAPVRRLRSKTTPPPGVCPPDIRDAEGDVSMDILAVAMGPENHGAVCEIYSPPRVAAEAARMGVPSGWSLDLTTEDAQGRPWNFDDVQTRARCRELIAKTKPVVLIGSPMCTWFSRLQRLNKPGMDPQRWARERARALMHLAFVFELYDIQVMGGGGTSCTSTRRLQILGNSAASPASCRGTPTPSTP